jgi:uncharacterized protein (DUF2164 family)
MVPRKYLSEELWNKLPILDFRARFFIEIYTEKLGMHTPHFYQSRLMNIFNGCKEALIYIDEFKSNEKNKSYVISALHEIENCWNEDPIAKQLLKHIEEARDHIFKKIQSGDFGASHLSRLRVVCNAILHFEDNYINTLSTSLHESVTGDTDLAKKGTITSDINTLTGIYITYLLNKGYSPTYLFNRSALLTRITNYGGRDFSQQLKLILDKLKNHKNSFDVYFALKSNKIQELLDIKEGSEIEFLDAIPNFISPQHASKLQKDFELNVVAKGSVESTDYVSASWRVKEKLDKVLDAVTALDLNPRIETSANCVTLYKNQQLHHAESLNIDILIRFLSSEGGTYFSNSGTSILHSLSVLNEHGRDHLGRSLRYLRLARNSISIEQKLLNLWISLESIYTDSESGILTNILEYVPQLYAVTAIGRRVCYIRDLLSENSISTPPAIKENITNGADVFTKNVSESKIFELIKNKSLCTDLFNSLGNLEHLKFRLAAIHEELKDNKSISNRLKKSQVDVERQLRRIYFLRNKIAHTGHYENIRPQLITHLLDYIAVCYMAVASSAKAARPVTSHSMNDLVSAYKMGADVVMHRARSTEEIARLDDLVPVPII